MSCLTVMALFTRNLFLQAKQFTNTTTAKFSSIRRTKSTENIQITAKPGVADSMHTALSVQQFLPPNIMAVVPTLLTYLSLCYLFFFLRKKLQLQRWCFKNVPCSQSFIIVIRFAGFCYGQFMTMRYKFNLVTYVQGPLVIDKRGGTDRNLNEITAGSQQQTLAVKGGKQFRMRAMWMSAGDCVYWMKRDLLLTLYSTPFLCIKYKTSK
jgi:hypothetical protein